MPKARKRKSVEGLDAEETYRDISIKVKPGRLRPSPDLRAAIEGATSCAAKAMTLRCNRNCVKQINICFVFQRSINTFQYPIHSRRPTAKRRARGGRDAGSPLRSRAAVPSTDHEADCVSWRHHAGDKRLQGRAALPRAAPTVSLPPRAHPTTAARYRMVRHVPLGLAHSGLLGGTLRKTYDIVSSTRGKDGGSAYQMAIRPAIPSHVDTLSPEHRSIGTSCADSAMPRRGRAHANGAAGVPHGREMKRLRPSCYSNRSKAPPRH